MATMRQELLGEIVALRSLVASLKSDMDTMGKESCECRRECKGTNLPTPAPPKVTPEGTGNSPGDGAEEKKRKKKEEKEKK